MDKTGEWHFYGYVDLSVAHQFDFPYEEGCVAARFVRDGDSSKFKIYLLRLNQDV